MRDNTPYLALVLAYRPADDGGRHPVARLDPRGELADDERPAYDALRAWRAARAKAEGLPPYMIASNRQLAQMIKAKSASRAALTRIEGVGEAKAAKYGGEILAILAKHLVRPPDAAPDADRQSES